MKKFYEDGYQTIMANSRSLYTVADKSAEMREYGIACSLMILAAEEAIKAAMCAMKFNDPEFPLLNWEEVFKLHKIKHQHIKGFIIAQQIKKEYMNNFRKDIRQRIENLTAGTSLDPDEQENAFYERMKESPLKIMPVDLTPDIDPDEILEWWNHADYLKQSGLYVGKSEKKWISPSKIGKPKFDDARRFTDILLNLSEELMEIYRLHHIPNNKL